MDEAGMKGWVEGVLGHDAAMGGDCHLRIGTWEGIASAAVFSGCGTYRYALVRIWDAGRPLWLFAMLNPSRADHARGDPTVDRQVERVRRYGGGGLIVVNAGAVIETDREAAVRHPDPIGLHNEAAVRAFAATADHIVVAYGPDACRFEGDRLLARALSGRAVQALRVTRGGQPSHPLYIGYAQPPMPFAMPADG